MDTIVIKVYSYDSFHIKDFAKSQFLPEFWRRYYVNLSVSEQESNRVYLRKFIFKPQHSNGYLPKIEVFERLESETKIVHYVFKITFSVPKLLYGNSVQEATSADLGRTIYFLEKALRNHGIEAGEGVLANAHVSEVHFCKNILLPVDLHMQDILGELRRVDMGKVVDVTKKEFKEGGQLLHIFSGNTEYVFYEKVADTLRPKVKRTDKGRVIKERGVIERYKLTNREIFRFERRFKNWQIVKRELNMALGRPLETHVLFKDIFTPNLSKTLLLGSWKKLLQRPENQLALCGPVNDLGLLAHMAAEAGTNPTAHSMNNVFASYGLATAIHHHGAKEVRNIIRASWNDEHPERLKEKFELALKLIRGIPASRAVTFIDTALERFEPVTLDN